MKWFAGLALGGLLFLPACSAIDNSSPRNDVVGALSSSVQLFAERAGGARRAGSGVIIANAEGRATILTAAHLVEPPVEQSVLVKATRGGIPITGKILAVDPEIDVAIIEAEGLTLPPAALGAGGRLGDEIWVISFPWGRHGTLVTGVISQVMAAEDDALVPYEGPVTLVDAAVSYGSSGGGVFDAESGALIAIVRGYRTAKLALPGTEAKPLEFPLAGETTVVPIERILCVMKAAQGAGKMELSPKLSNASPSDCDKL